MIGKRNGGKFITQRATQIVAGEFPVAGGCHRAIKLICKAVSVLPFCNQKTLALFSMSDITLDKFSNKQHKPS
jgi:hypothetical protein